MPTRSKRYRESSAKVENRAYPIDEALEVLQGLPKAKFDQTVELHMRLGIDPISPLV